LNQSCTPRLSLHCSSLGWLITVIPLLSRLIMVRKTFMAKHASSWSRLLSTVTVSKLWHAVAGLYLCVCPAARPFAITLIRHFVSSWEFVTTLDYEWNLFRRRRAFRWTIWVGDNSRFLLGFHPGAERFTNLSPLVGLLHHAHSHSIGCSTFISCYQRYDPIQLQGARISHLLLMRP
jgi:hypothetical protein